MHPIDSPDRPVIVGGVIRHNPKRAGKSVPKVKR
jgi:hypothetical protein